MVTFLCVTITHLFLDDIRDPAGGAWTTVRSVDDAKRIMLDNHVEYMSLDHDLGECEACARRNALRKPQRMSPIECRHVPTGYDFVLWMAETGNWPMHKPTIHSANPVGRKAMQQTIDRYFPGEQ